MIHLRQQIREALADALGDQPTSATRIYTSRVYPFDALPCLAVYTPSEERDEDADVQGGPEVRKLVLRVECRAESTDGVDDALDTLCAEVEAAVYADPGLAGLAMDTRLLATTIELSDEGKQPTGLAVMDFETFYEVNASDPEIGIP